MTVFQILVQSGGSTAWVERGSEESHSAGAAVKANYLKHPEAAITAMVAVPERSWKPQQVRVETQQKVILGAAQEGAAEGPSA